MRGKHVPQSQITFEPTKRRDILQFVVSEVPRTGNESGNGQDCAGYVPVKYGTKDGPRVPVSVFDSYGCTHQHRDTPREIFHPMTKRLKWI